MINDYPWLRKHYVGYLDYHHFANLQREFNLVNVKRHYLSLVSKTNDLLITTTFIFSRQEWFVM